MSPTTNTQVYDVGLKVIYNPDNGDLFAPFNHTVIPLGNVRTGQLYVFRQYAVTPEGGVSMPEKHVSVADVKMPEGSLEVKIAFLTQLSMFVSMGYQKDAKLNAMLTVGNFMTLLTDSHVPELVEAKATGFGVTMQLMEALLAARQGLIGMYELMRTAERAAALFSTMPEAFLTAPIAWKQEGVTLVDGNGQALQ